MTQPSERSELLTTWVKKQHKGQVKRYIGDPYFVHLLAVAKMAKDAIALGYEIGLCHDLLEDTRVTTRGLIDVLIGFGYNNAEAEYITACVVELTDLFTSAAYPKLGRNKRKRQEDLRLQSISPAAQTIKYCDLIDNMPLVLKYERKHAKAYLQRKRKLLLGMTEGDAGLHQKALQIISDGMLDLVTRKPNTMETIFDRAVAGVRKFFR